MAQDREFYKKAYKNTWDDGNRRELIVQSLLESWGFEVEYTGFMAMSNKYTPDSPEEKSVPDFTIYNNLGKKIWIEVTGTNHMGLNQKIWIRPSKIDYAKKHKLAGQTYVAHVVTSKLLVRFVDTTNIQVNQLPIIRPHMHNHQSLFYTIPFQYVISREKMKNRLLAWRNQVR